MQNNRGGPRRGAGRPKIGRKAFTLRAKPSAMNKLKLAALRKKQTPGELLEEMFKE